LQNISGQFPDLHLQGFSLIIVRAIFRFATKQAVKLVLQEFAFLNFNPVSLQITP
jgi:hypothetical protein